MSAPQPTVFIVDDDESVRRGLSRLLRAADHEVAVYASGPEFLDAHDPVAPGCLVLDMAMPEFSGRQVQLALADRRSALPIIFLTGRADVPMCARAIKEGASDFLIKPVKERELLAAVDRAMEANLRYRLARAEKERFESLLRSLTPREREVMEHLVTGILNKQIAAALGTVEKTIKVHRARVMEKMRVTSIAELVRMVERMAIGRGSRDR